MSFTNTLTRYDAALVDLIGRRPELRDVGIAGYLVGAAVDGGPGMPAGRTVAYWVPIRVDTRVWAA